MLRRFSIRTKLLLVVAAPLAAIGVLVALALPTFQSVKVGGSQYSRLANTKDLIADILPPPGFLVEAHLTVTELALLASNPDGATGVTARAAIVAELQTLMQGYDASHEFWDKRLTDSALRNAMLEQAYRPAREYMRVVREAFLPALAAGRDDEAVQIARVELDSLFDEHRVAIAATAALAGTQNTQTEAEVSSFVSERFTILGVAALLAISFTAVLGVIVSRAINRPVRRLTEAAMFASSEGLPQLVNELQDAPADAELPTPARFESGTEDELSNLATALNAMQDTAVGLAAGQARARRTVSENLANLGRRNQSMLSRTLSFISTLERDERDSATLANLFRLDHLVTRIRRNADSLVVLAGTDAPAPWSQPVDLGEIIRAALSQIEGYDRVDFSDVVSVALQGAFADNMAHLLAELLENATNYSPPTSPVTVRGRMRSDGYVVSVSDEGIGMTEEALALANHRVSSASDFDQTPSRVLGHLVVGRLSLRQGLAVRLSASPTGQGVTVAILIPRGLLEGVIEGAATSDGSTDHPGVAQPSIESTPSALIATTERAKDKTFAVAPARMAGAEAPSPAPTAAPTAAPKPTPAAQPAVASEPVSTDGGSTRNGLSRRVRGAQLPDTGPSPTVGAKPADPEKVRSALSSIQRGTQKGREDAQSPINPSDPDPTDAASIEAPSRGATPAPSKPATRS